MTQSAGAQLQKPRREKYQAKAHRGRRDEGGVCAEAVTDGDDGIWDAAGLFEVDPLVSAEGEAQRLLLCTRVWLWRLIREGGVSAEACEGQDCAPIATTRRPMARAYWIARTKGIRQIEKCQRPALQ